MHSMNADEIQAEMNYRYLKRLCLLCLDGAPSAVETTMADTDANTWLMRFHTAQEMAADASTRHLGK